MTKIKEGKSFTDQEVVTASQILDAACKGVPAGTPLLMLSWIIYATLGGN